MSEQLPPAPPAEAGAETPAFDFTDSPAFKDAVAKAAADAVAQIMARATPAPEGLKQDASPQAFAEGLAMAIASLTDQGSGRKRVAPEVMQARAEARERMEKLIAEARENGDVPRYRLVSQVYLDEIKVDPKWVDKDRVARDTLVDWPGVPNEAMRPVNESAQAIYAAFMDSIGSVVKVVPDKPSYVTASGLVVHGRAPLRRSDIGQQQPGNGHPGEGLRIAHKDAPGQYQPINVLGTIAAPAVQSA